MQGYVSYVVKNLVHHPDLVSLSTAERGGQTVYQVRVHPDDVGKVIGRQGVTINAIRSLLLAATARTGARCAVELVED